VTKAIAESARGEMHREPAVSPRRAATGPTLLAALWGVSIAWLTAALVVTLARKVGFAPPGLGGSDVSVKRFEELFYLTFYPAATVFAFAAARFAQVFGNRRAALIGFALFFPFTAFLASTAIHAGPYAFSIELPPLDPSKWGVYASRVIPVTYWFAVPIAALLLPFVGRTRASQSQPQPSLDAPEPSSGPIMWKHEAPWLFACAVLFSLCLFPIDLIGTARQIGFDKHVVSFYIGPSLFLRQHGLIPGVDFFPQYGIGIGAMFSLFLRPSVAATVGNTVLVTAGLSALYFTTALATLRKLYASRLLAFVVVLFALILCFHLATEFEDPSGWPARYFLMFSFVGAFAIAAGKLRRKTALAVAGLLAGMCLFWNTETGLYVVAASLVATVLLDLDIRTVGQNLGALVAGELAGFWVPTLAAYGPGVLQPGFFVGLIKPMTIYAGGLGAFPIIWSSPFNFVCAVVSPFIGFATMGWAAAALVRGDSRYSKSTLSVLFLLSLIGNCLMLKWLNMSYDALWYVNSLPILAVSAWWGQRAIFALRKLWPDERSYWVTRVVPAALLAGAIAFLCFVRDDRNPSKYALQSFILYPSVLVGAFQRRPRVQWTPPRPKPEDIALLQRCSAPGTRLEIVSDEDWTYLLVMGRTPQLPWLPSATMYAFPFLVHESMRFSGPIFLDRAISLTHLGALGDDLTARLKSAYAPGATGHWLQVYNPLAVPRSRGC
jgi:hypothetical protein